MASSSASRSRSAKRSPSRKEEGDEKPSKPEKSEALPAAPDAKEGEKPERTDEWNKEVPEKKEPRQGSFQDKARAVRTRSAGGGAVRNRRAAGTPGTFECPECYRVIQDNRTARDQHWDSRHCRAHRLYNRGYGSMEQCFQLADHEIQKEWQKWTAGQSVRLQEKPNEPKGPPPNMSADSSGYRQHRDRRQEEEDYRRERRSPDRKRRSARKDIGDQEEETSRARRRKRDRSGCGKAESEYEHVKVEKESRVRAAEVRKSSRPAAAQGSKGKDARRKESQRQQGEETQGSSEYTYTYDEASSVEEVKDPTQKKSASASATKAAAEELREKKPEKSRTVLKQSAAVPANPKGNDQDNRVQMFSSLLRTAMETASNCGM